MLSEAAASSIRLQGRRVAEPSEARSILDVMALGVMAGDDQPARMRRRRHGERSQDGDEAEKDTAWERDMASD